MSGYEKTIRDYYDEVNKLWEMHLNPTLKLSIITLNPKIPNLYYTNFNNILSNTNINVNAIFDVNVALDGSLEEGNLGNLDILEITNEGYSSKFFFDECAYYLTNLVTKFLKEYGVGNYQTVIAIYTDLLEMNQLQLFAQANSAKQQQVKVKGSVETTTNSIDVTYTGGTYEISTTNSNYYLFTFNAKPSVPNTISFGFNPVVPTILPCNILAIGPGGYQYPLTFNGISAGGFVSDTEFLSSDNRININVGISSLSPENTTLTYSGGSEPFITAYSGVRVNENGPSGGGGEGTVDGITGASGGKAVDGTQGHNGGNAGTPSSTGEPGGVGGGGGAGTAGGNGGDYDPLNKCSFGGNGGDGLASIQPGMPTTVYAGGQGGRGINDAAGYCVRGKDGNGCENPGGGCNNGRIYSQNGIVLITLPIDYINSVTQGTS